MEIVTNGCLCLSLGLGIKGTENIVENDDRLPNIDGTREDLCGLVSCRPPDVENQTNAEAHHALLLSATPHSSSTVHDLVPFGEGFLRILVVQGKEDGYEQQEERTRCEDEERLSILKERGKKGGKQGKEKKREKSWKRKKKRNDKRRAAKE